MRKRLLTRLAAAGAGGALALAAVSPAMADHGLDDIVTVPEGSEVTFADVAVFPGDGPDDCDFDTVKVESDADGAGEWSETVGDFEFIVVQTEDGHVNVEAKGGAEIHSVHIFGGANTHSYYFDPAVTSAKHLTPPNNPGDQTADVSHVWFCYGEPGDDDTPPGEEEETPPGEEEETPPGEEEETPPGEEAEEENGEELPQTGAQLGGMLVLAFGLVAAGAAMMFVRRRRNLASLLES
jgi:LPXTG-motif cell wall-anchored protein